MIAPRIHLPAGCALYVRPGSGLDALQPALSETGITVYPAESLLRGAPGSAPGPAVLLVDHELAGHLPGFSDLPGHATIVAGDDGAENALGEAADLSIALIADVPGQLRILRTAFQLSACRRDAESAHLELSRSRIELAELNRLGMALMTEHDHDALLLQIVQQVMRMTNSDAGGLFLIEKPDAGPPLLRLEIVSSDSYSNLPDLQDILWPVDSTSLVGHVALTGKPLVVDNCHDLPAGAPYRVNMFVQEELGYWMKSMLVMPMIDHEGQVVGVLQLANRKCGPEIRLNGRNDVEQHVIPYSDHDVELGQSLAGQAAVSIENAQLYGHIEHLFECFVRAAVTAIDQRDPSTSGHSVRVATLVTDLAEAVERSGRGKYQGLSFTPAQLRELRYAALLHDFGKVGVREEVLIKARKLPPSMWAHVEARFDLIRCTMELQYERKRLALKASHRRTKKQLEALEARFRRELAEVERFWSAIRIANEPTILAEDAASTLTEAAAREFVRPGGRVEPFLTLDELHYLQIPRGSLDEHERREVETHAAQTFDFLSQIPWTDDLKHIAGYASGHHEKLNGTGYPHHLAAENIAVQTRLITIADVFDALTAADRPYKPAVSAEAALDIIRQEADSGLLDPDLVDVLIESRVYRRVMDNDWRQL